MLRKKTNTYYDIKRLIEKYNKPNCSQIDKSLIEKLFTVDEYLIIKCYSSEMAAILEMLDKHSNLYQILVEQIKNYIEKLLSNDFQNQEYIKENRPYEDIFDIKASLEKFDEFKSIIRQYFKKNVEKVIERIYDYIQFKMLKLMCKEKSEMDYILQQVAHSKSEQENIPLTILKQILIGLCKREKINFEDIEKIGSGKFSEVYGINDKVVKICRGRGTWKIPDNPYMLRPLIRELIKIDKTGFNGKLYIEVAEKVETINKVDDNKEFKEELYNLYVALRKMGIIWCDVKSDNVGRLKKPQETSFISNEFLSINDNPMYSDKIILPKGSLVLIDCDLIFTEEEFDSLLKRKNGEIHTIMNVLSYEFYKRYEEEYFIGPRQKNGRR